jgi:hypothetical protein
MLGFLSTDVLNFDFDGVGNFVTTAVYRDVSAWYHVVFVVDTTQTTGRAKIYVNNSEVFSGLVFNLNEDTPVNNSTAHEIGRDLAANNYFNGYLADINFIDGQALTPSSFGETDSDTGVWKPKAYSGSYGTNGFYLKFADNSGTTSTTLGKDSSGNGNNWTPNNFSVTAGSGNDSLVDTPTPYGTDTGAGGEVRGNYCTLNPIASGAVGTFSNGNLDWANTNNTQGCIATMAIPSTGKWYAECTVNYFTGGYEIYIGVNVSSAAMNGGGRGGETLAWSYSGNGNKVLDTTATSYGASYTIGDVIGIAIDRDASTLTFYKNGVSQGAISSLPTAKEFFWLGGGGGPVANTHGGTWNFGQRPFAYTAPSGFKALCTQNLPEPTVVQGDDYFNTVLYTGNGSAPRTITGVGFQPDWVWVKSRSNTYAHFLWDAVRGTNLNLFSNLTSAEANVATGSTDGGISTSASDGFTLTAGTGSSNNVNNNGSTYVAWNWKANGSGVSNTDGSITSTVSANTTSGFSIVTYTGTAANATVGHGLGVAPSMIIAKSRSVAQNWAVYHSSLGNTKWIQLNSTGAAITEAIWNNTSPTSTVFSLNGNGVINESASTNVAYCFAEVPGFSAFGSYTGNGSADGPFIYTGFRPAFVLIKNSSNSGYSWYLFDNKRLGYNPNNNFLNPNSSSAETTYTTGPDQLSNGFKLRDTDAAWNGSGNTYIYAAFSEVSFKYALGR